ncbi:MAG: orotate phosphoribosyltransferase [Candidatus Aenigmarchaeota archaeon]|nr:orotate phosphoribosyltransferase [Candidatus Aenigmarchaeota archaeon]
MKIKGICQICGKTGIMHSCSLCGRLVCSDCYDSKKSLCRICAAKFTEQ